MSNNKAIAGEWVSVERYRILLGRMQKLADYQSRNANLKHCHVIGGELPLDIKEKIRTPEFQAKLQARIDKAERIRFNIALILVNDATRLQTK